MPSPRALLAERIAAFVRDNDLAQVFGGESDLDKNKDGRRYRSVDFSLARTLDGTVRIYSPRFIQILSAGPHGTGSEVFTSEADALAFMQARWVDFDHEAAEAVPRKAPK